MNLYNLSIGKLTIWTEKISAPLNSLEWQRCWTVHSFERDKKFVTLSLQLSYLTYKLTENEWTHESIKTGSNKLIFASISKEI